MFNKLKSHLYVLQLLEYDPDRFLIWFIRNWGFFPLEKKGRLGWSPKARLLYLGSMLIQLIISTGLGFIFYQRGLSLYSVVLAIVIFSLINLILHFLPLIPLTLTLFFFQPFEYCFSLYLTQKATQIIRNHKNLRVVGITGSFGKTSVKHILAQILAKKFKIVATLESYNKKISIARTIVNNTKPETEIFIVEMGAYSRGEISEICRMAQPEIGIITGLTNQHLERFGSLENIKKSKNELVKSLPQNGFAIFNVDNPGSKELYESCSIKKEGYSLLETKIEIKNGSTHFSLFGQNVRTSLLGEHNVLNVLAAAKVARYLGLAESEIIERIEHLQPVPHRLELILGDHRALIIDDAYSSNTEGYKAAFNLVKVYPNYPKVLVTPGLVELGKKQKEENRRMAQAGSSVFDYVIVVNLVNRLPLISSFIENGWSLYNPLREEKPERWQVAYEGVKKDKIVFAAKDLNEATEDFLPKISRSGSLILLENDLPDIYR